MHFAVDGTLWEDAKPGPFHIMARALLEGLSARDHHITLMGKGPDLPPALAAAPKPPGSIQWLQVDTRLSDRLSPNGWLQKSVPRAMKACGAQKWLGWDGPGLPPGHRQAIFLKDVSGLLWPGPEGISRSAASVFAARWGALLRDPSSDVLTFSRQMASLLTERFGAAEGRIHVLPAFYRQGVTPPLPWETRESTKMTYARGREYFLCLGMPGDHWLDTLKAFSLFKVRQRSQMRLLLAPWTAFDPAFLHSLASYKYRQDVDVLDIADWEKVARSAYAIVATTPFDDTGWMPAMALAEEVPLIGTSDSVAREWAEGAITWVRTDSPDSVAEAMLRLYKDESLRGQLLARGRELAAQRSPLDQYEQVLKK
jgi:hypothetical protein